MVQKTTDNFRSRKKLFCELYPRFDDLENGNYPSLPELGEYRNQGFNFGQYYSQSLIDRCQYMEKAKSRSFKVKSHSLVDESTVQLAPPVEQVQSEDELFDDFEVNEYELLSYEDGSTTEGGTVEKSPPRNDVVVVEEEPAVPEVKKQKRVRFSDLESVSTFSDMDYIKVPLLNGGAGCAN